MSYTSDEIQNISSEFRNVARRLSRTDYSQCAANLKRLMSTIKSNKIIEDFILKNNTRTYDIESIIKTRDRLAPFEISPDACEEISFEYQLLTYAIDKFDGDFTQLYGTYWYTSYKSTVNDEMRKFIEHIIDPLIDYISEYLRHCYEKAVKEEEKTMPTVQGGIMANNSTIVLGSKIDGNVSTQVTINDDTKNNAIELISAIKDSLQDSIIDAKEDIMEILIHIEEDLRLNKSPKKGLLPALKALCAGSTQIISLVTALIKLYSTQT